MTSGRRKKVITPEAAAQLIVDGDTLAVGGFVGIAVPEELLIALAKRKLPPPKDGRELKRRAIEGAKACGPADKRSKVASDIE